MAKAMLTVVEMVAATRCAGARVSLLVAVIGYFPWNLGLRFSLKARTPSRRSSVVTVLL